MKATITLAIIILTTFTTHAQHQFKPGSVTYRDGTTVHGLIDYKEWGLNPESVTFREGKDTRKLTPHELSAFAIDDIESFETGLVSNKYSGYIKTSEASVNSVILVGRPSEIKNDTVFLRRTIEGRLYNLYQWENINTTKYFVKNNTTGELTELIIDIHFNPDRPEKKIITRKYIGQFSIFAEDPQARNKDKVVALLDDKLPYKESSFRILINMLNGSDKKAPSQAMLTPYAGLALQSSWISYSGDFNMGTTKPSFYPAVNAGLDLYPNRYVKRLWLRFNFGFSGGNFNTSKDSLAGTHESMTYTQKINMYTISFSPQLLINVYNTSALRVNAGIGAMVNYSIYITNDFTQERTYFGITGNSPIRYDLEHFWLSAPVRAGVMLANKLDIFAQYNICLSPLTTMRGRVARCSGFQLGINYCF